MCEPKGICKRRVCAEPGGGGHVCKETAPPPPEVWGCVSLLRVRPTKGRVSVQKQTLHLLGKTVGATPVPRGAASASL